MLTRPTTADRALGTDDWAYEHLGVYGWIIKFWDLVHATTGEKISTYFWNIGPTDHQAIAALHWLDN